MLRKSKKKKKGGGGIVKASKNEFQRKTILQPRNLKLFPSMCRAIKVYAVFASSTVLQFVRKPQRRLENKKAEQNNIHD